MTVFPHPTGPFLVVGPIAFDKMGGVVIRYHRFFNIKLQALFLYITLLVDKVK